MNLARVVRSDPSFRQGQSLWPRVATYWLGRLGLVAHGSRAAIFGRLPVSAEGVKKILIKTFNSTILSYRMDVNIIIGYKLKLSSCYLPFSIIKYFLKIKKNEKNNNLLHLYESLNISDGWIIRIIFENHIHVIEWIKLFATTNLWCK